MSKFTDDFFGFPIKLYDGFSLKKAMEQEDKEGVEEPVPIDWVVGIVKLPAKDLIRLMWHDGFTRDRTVSDVAENGFDTTTVVCEPHGEFICTWPRKKFEEKLNDFMEKWNASKTPVIQPYIHIEPLPYTGPSGFEFTTTSGDQPKKDPE